MSTTMDHSHVALGADLGRVKLAAGALRAHLVSRAAAAPTRERDRLLPLINALDSFDNEDTTHNLAAHADAPMLRTEQMSALRQYLYTRTAYAPAPVFHLAGGLGRALRFLGL